MYRFMLQEDVASFDLSSVQNFATAGEPLNAEVTLAWERLTGKKIREGFGQTEGPVLLGHVPLGRAAAPDRWASRRRC